MDQGNSLYQVHVFFEGALVEVEAKSENEAWDKAIEEIEYNPDLYVKPENKAHEHIHKIGSNN